MRHEERRPIAFVILMRRTLRCAADPADRRLKCAVKLTRLKYDSFESHRNPITQRLRWFEWPLSAKMAKFAARLAQISCRLLTQAIFCFDFFFSIINWSLYARAYRRPSHFHSDNLDKEPRRKAHDWDILISKLHSHSERNDKTQSTDLI